MEAGLNVAEDNDAGYADRLVLAAILPEAELAIWHETTELAMRPESELAIRPEAELAMPDKDIVEGYLIPYKNEN